MKGPRGALFLVLGLAIVATGRSLGNGFTFDDVPIILENAQVHAFRHPGFMPARVTGPQRTWATHTVRGRSGGLPFNGRCRAAPLGSSTWSTWR